MKNDTKKNKKLMIQALEKTLGIVTPACIEVGISRNTFYTWYKEDKEFKELVDDLNEITIDFVETQLLKAIKEGSERSILFYMKYKGKKRGYTDNIDITTNNESLNRTIPIIFVDRDDSEDEEDE